MNGNHKPEPASFAESDESTARNSADQPTADNDGHPPLPAGDIAGSSEAPVELSLPSNGDRPFYIVGVGASAGGLEALELLFEKMPMNSGLAFVVVQHLSPDFKSVMDELLGRRTRIPIHRVEDGMRVEPNAIYLIPPKKEMAISNGKLLLTDKDPDQGLNLPIDIFLRSLAHDAGARSVGIILSGTGSDGSRGICDIHAAGGLVLVQDLESCKFDGMPKNAIETGIVDLVLPPQEIPEALLTYTSYTDRDGRVIDPSPAATPRGFDAIFQLLRKGYDIDFSHYKRTTVARRVQRRLLMNQIVDLESYVDRLRTDDAELNLLYKDLLIGVTKFFRDADAFKLLESEILPQLLSRVRQNGEIRVWVAGCATGEEAYSIAILLHELVEKFVSPIKAKIFATDVHRASLELASAGIYGEDSLSEVSPARLERYFSRTKNGFQVMQELRQMIVFAPHNIIKDAPFTKLDLITCRNLLIYLEPLAQKKALSLFHFGLTTGGVLLLGPSETPGELSDEFEVLDGHWRIFRKRRDRRLPIEMRMPMASGIAQPRVTPTFSQGRMQDVYRDPSLTRAYDALLEEFAPPSLLINEHRELVQSFSGASRYLQWRDGKLTTDILELITSDLKLPLTTALAQCNKKQSAVMLSGLPVRSERGEERVRMSVRPLSVNASEMDYFLISFEPQDAPTDWQVERETEVSLDDASREHMKSLETELSCTRENLQATVEEMETSNEELQAANEELIASNEELQSTNEELHSVNEELYTVNAEYQKKIAELTEMTNDMNNLLQSTEVGVIFLDRDLCIRKFTPQIARTFNLLPHDIGRPIQTFSHSIIRPELLQDVRRAFETEEMFETDVEDESGVEYLLRVIPYQAKKRVEGVVLTLIDISRLKQVEKKLRLMSKVFHDGADPIILEDLEGRIIDLNQESELVYGWTREELVGRDIECLVPPAECQRMHELREECRSVGFVRNAESVRCAKSGRMHPVLLTLSRLTDTSGETLGIASIAKDISVQKQSEFLAHEAVRRRDQFLAMLSHELRNPLGAVLNATYLIGALGGVSDEVAEACSIIQRQALQMARLLDDLLDVSRVTQGKIEMRKEVLDLTQLVNDAVQAVQPTFDSRGHQLVIDVVPGPVYVEGDATRLLQIQENLLENAAKYTPPRGTVFYSLFQEGHEAVIRVRDTGRGIPTDMLEPIFDLFVQSDEALDRTEGGMGVGLTLVKTLVKIHGGTVNAFSDGADRGSEFVVRLPCSDKPILQKLDAPPFAPVNRKILIIEDNDDSRQMLESLLRLEGYSVAVAKDGRQGFELIQSNRPDIAIVDIGLPELSGYEIANRVRQDEQLRDTWLIALTGYGREEDRKAVRDAGFDAHLIKPLKRDELTRVLALTGRNTKR